MIIHVLSLDFIVCNNYTWIIESRNEESNKLLYICTIFEKFDKKNNFDNSYKSTEFLIKTTLRLIRAWSVGLTEKKQREQTWRRRRANEGWINDRYKKGSRNSWFAYMLISGALIGDDKQSNYSEKGRDLVGAARTVVPAPATRTKYPE